VTDLADVAIRVLSDRKGFDWWWEDLDTDIQEDIKQELREALEEHTP
jgi:hypothetical protein